jgi:hypothetical protein
MANGNNKHMASDKGVRVTGRSVGCRRVGTHIDVKRAKGMYDIGLNKCKRCGSMCQKHK